MTYSEEKLRAAIRTMRDFCDTAEHKLSFSDISEYDKVTAVIHAFAWGLANASNDINTAISGIARELQRKNKES